MDNEEDPMKIILYHMTGCPHCIEQEGEYPKLPFEFTSKIERANINDAHRKSYGIKVFPTIVFTTDRGRLLGKLEGKRTVDQIKAAYSVYSKSGKYR